MNILDTRLGLIRAMAEAPDDEAPRLIFADWIEEHGDENERACVHRLRHNRGYLDVAIVGWLLWRSPREDGLDWDSWPLANTSDIGLDIQKLCACGNATNHSVIWLGEWVCYSCINDAFRHEGTPRDQRIRRRLEEINQL